MLRNGRSIWLALQNSVVSGLMQRAAIGLPAALRMKTVVDFNARPSLLMVNNVFEVRVPVGSNNQAAGNICHYMHMHTFSQLNNADAVQTI